jgi:ubiquinone/menaquinone biosynthesis C-methylase UbiE
MYDRYASVYDGSGQVRYSLLIAPYLAEVLEQHPAPDGRILDLACGTGTLALMLANEGHEVLGLDLSAAMLAQARAKAVHIELTGQVEFVQGDMRYLAALLPPEQFGLVTSVYDSLNYLLNEDDLLACFQGIAHVLQAGGLFFGDMNTAYFLEHEWVPTEILEQTGYVQICRSTFDPLRCQMTMMLTGFVGNDQRGYERFDEVHAERAYSVATVKTLLLRAGLDLEAVYECFTFDEPGARTHRTVWVARKPPGV